ncbi:MAG: hypothetical protein IPJ07_07015 [Acidobacteria bacterium]|nr:hypothetical protein [Acidobacteriota bacterium]
MIERAPGGQDARSIGSVDIQNYAVKAQVIVDGYPLSPRSNRQFGRLDASLGDDKPDGIELLGLNAGHRD